MRRTASRINPGLRLRLKDPTAPVLVLPELRAQQARDAGGEPRCTTLYSKVKWDLQDSPIPANVFRASTLRSASMLLASGPTLVEIPEPLFIRELPRSAAVGFAAKTGARLRGRRCKVVTYAIENNDLDALFALGPFNLVRPALRFVAASIARRLYDHIVFGSAGARQTYLELCPDVAGRSTLVEEIPAPAAGPEERRDSTVVFVGELSPRKGPVLAMRAWESIETEVPGSRIVLVGTGPLASEVEAWCAARPTQRTFAGLIPQRQVAEVMRAATVLIAPSVRQGRWREQIGLPISEGLAAGLTIVTSDETGLAGWLEEHGHHVIGVEDLNADLAPHLLAAVRHPMSPEQVRSPLPSVSGRARARAELRDTGRWVATT